MVAGALKKNAAFHSVVKLMVQCLPGVFTDGNDHMGSVVLEELDAGGGTETAGFRGARNFPHKTDGEAGIVGGSLTEDFLRIPGKSFLQHLQFPHQNRCKMLAGEPVITGLKNRGILSG